MEGRAEEGRKGFNSDLAKRKAKHGRHCFRLMLHVPSDLPELPDREAANTFLVNFCRTNLQGRSSQPLR